MVSRASLPTITTLILTALLAVSRPSQAAESEMTIILSAESLERCAQVIMPLKLQGTQTAGVSLPVVGTLRADIRWVAVVKNPKITITKEAATFVADVDVQSGPLQYADKVDGVLEASFDKRRNQIVIVVKKAFVNLKMQQGPATTSVKLDVSSQMPPLQFPVGLPNPVLKVGKETVRIEMDPQLSLDTGALVVKSKLEFIARGQRKAP